MKPAPLAATSRPRVARPRRSRCSAEHGDDAKLLAGGQSLVPLLNFRLASPGGAGRPEPAGVARRRSKVDDFRFPLGALCTQRDTRASTAERAGRMPAARPRRSRYVGHVATRNRGTVGGSIAHADAASGAAPAATDAGRRGRGEHAGRRPAFVPAEEFFVSHLTSCPRARRDRPPRCASPSTGPGWGAGFAEVAPRHGDYAVCAVACALRVEGGVVREAPAGRRSRLRPAVASSRGAERALHGLALRARGAVDGCGGEARRRGRPERTACTPPPSTAGTSRACSRAGAPSAPRSGRSRGDEVWRSPSTAARVYELVDPRLLLSDLLRHRSACRGTHIGCEHGVCGACTVPPRRRTPSANSSSSPSRPTAARSRRSRASPWRAHRHSSARSAPHPRCSAASARPAC